MVPPFDRRVKGSVPDGLDIHVPLVLDSLICHQPRHLSRAKWVAVFSQVVTASSRAAFAKNWSAERADVLASCRDSNVRWYHAFLDAGVSFRD